MVVEEELGITIDRVWGVVYTRRMAEQEQDEQLKEVCKRRVAAKLEAVADFLEKVGLDDGYRDKRLVAGKEGHRIVDVPIPVNMRVGALKIWKEMLADKAVGDVKEKAREKKERGYDMQGILRELTEELKKNPDGDPEQEL